MSFQLTFDEFMELTPYDSSRQQLLKKLIQVEIIGIYGQSIDWKNIKYELKKLKNYSCTNIINSFGSFQINYRKNLRAKQNRIEGAIKYHMTLFYWLYFSVGANSSDQVRRSKAAERIVEAFFGMTLEEKWAEHIATENDIFEAANGFDGDPSSEARGVAIIDEKDLQRSRGKRFLRYGLRDKCFQNKHLGLFVAIIDVDDLTKINNVHGWKIGDDILNILERLISDCIRIMGILEEKDCDYGICGHDTFYISFYKSYRTEVVPTLDKILSMFRDYNWSGVSKNLHVTCSIGLAERTHHETSFKCAVRAGSGMQTAKLNGGDKWEMAPKWVDDPDPNLPNFGWS